MLDRLFDFLFKDENDPSINKTGTIILAILISAIIGIVASYRLYGEIEWLGVILSVIMFGPIWILIILSLTKK